MYRWPVLWLCSLAASAGPKDELFAAVSAGDADAVQRLRAFGLGIVVAVGFRFAMDRIDVLAYGLLLISPGPKSPKLFKFARAGFWPVAASLWCSSVRMG